jgi:ABC-type thiamine transport system substrate-binding protein
MMQHVIPPKNWIIPKAVRTKLDNVEQDVKKLKQAYSGKNIVVDTQVDTPSDVLIVYENGQVV